MHVLSSAQENVKFNETPGRGTFDRFITHAPCVLAEFIRWWYCCPCLLLQASVAWSASTLSSKGWY